MGLVRILIKQLLDLSRFAARQPGGSRLAFVWVHSQIKRTLQLVGKATRRIVELHGRTSEIREDHICAVNFQRSEHSLEPCEIGMHQRQGIGAEAEASKALLGPGEFDRIRIQPEQSPARADGLEQFEGMSAITECRIHCHLSRHGPQDLQHFRHTNGTMHACGSLAGGQNLFESLGVFFRIQLLIFLLETARVPSRIARASFGPGGRSFHVWPHVKKGFMLRRSFLVGRPEPFGRWKIGMRKFFSRGFSNSDAGVRSSINCPTNLAPTRFSRSAVTLTVRVISPVIAVITSPNFTEREALTICSPTFTLPAPQAAAARLRDLKSRTAQSHLSILTAAMGSTTKFCSDRLCPSGLIAGLRLALRLPLPMRLMRLVARTVTLAAQNFKLPAKILDLAFVGMLLHLRIFKSSQHVLHVVERFGEFLDDPFRLLYGFCN